MKYCVEIIRDENGDVSQRNILFAVNGVSVMPRGKECLFIEGPDDADRVVLQRASVDENGSIFIEDDPAKVAAQDQEVAIALRIKRQDYGRRVIAIITIRNDAKDLTAEQEAQIAASFTSINIALMNGRIDNAKADIQAITPDGTLVTQADKDAILAEITANEAALGY